MLSKIAQILSVVCSPLSELDHPSNNSQRSSSSSYTKSIRYMPLDKLTSELAKWAMEGEPTENRAIAQTRILEAFNYITPSLDLRNLGLKSLPPCINQLRTIKWLSLSYNRLKTLPAEIGSLRDLETLEISHNSLKNLPPEICKLKQLKQIYAYCNQISELPKEIGNLQKLERLWLFDNQLSTLPIELFQLKALRGLGLGYNNLSALPAELEQLTRLNELYINHNQLTSLPEEIKTLEHLESIEASNNPLQSLPVSIAKLPKLVSLRLDNTPELKTLDARLQTFWETKTLRFHRPIVPLRDTIFPTRHTLANRYGNKRFINTTSEEKGKEA